METMLMHVKSGRVDTAIRWYDEIRSYAIDEDDLFCYMADLITVEMDESGVWVEV